MLKRNFYLLISFLFTVLLLCGCYDYSDIESELIVSGLAVDLTENEKGEQMYLVTAEVVVNGTDSDQGSSSKSEIIQNADKTPLAAIKGIMEGASKKLFFGHCKLLVLSDSVAKQGISTVLDLVFRDRELRFSMNIAVARDCKAYELFSVSTAISSIKSYEIVQTVKTVSSAYGTASQININGLLNCIHNGSGAAKVPYFTVSKDYDGNDVYYLDGVAVFNGGRLSGFIPSHKSVFCILASGELSRGTITCTVPSSSFPFTFNIVKSSTDIDLKKMSGGGLLTLNIDLSVSFAEIPEDMPYFTSTDSDIIIGQISKYVSDNVFAVVKDTIDRYGADIFYFTPKLAVVYPKYLASFDSMEDFLRTLKIKVTTNVSLEDNGLSGGNFYSENENG